MPKRVVVSGGFDPLHEGHVNLFRAAKALGDSLVVIVEHDAYVSSKHPLLMHQEERAAVVRGMDCVDVTIRNPDESGDCSGILSSLRPHIFAVGPDHEDVTQLPEWKMCVDLGINVVCLNSLPKGERTSSSKIVRGIASSWDNPPVTVSVVVRQSNGACLIGRKGGGRWELPGGFLERDESLEQCGARELREETGIVVPTCNMHYLVSKGAVYEDGRQIVSCYFWVCVDSVKPAPTSELEDFAWVTSAPPRDAWKHDVDYQALQRVAKL